MSSSSRKKRSDPDNFPTPVWALRRFLERFDISELGNSWLEPSAGDGSIIETVDEFKVDLSWLAIELRDTRADLQALGLSDSQIIIDDFFCIEPGPFDVAILNPPFKLGIEFVMKCRCHADYVIVFQTLNFLGSSKRNEWLRGDFPDIYVIPDRVAHKGTSRSDSVYSAWYVWGPEKKSSGETILLECTSKQERVACYSRLRRATNERDVTLRSMLEVIT